MRILDTLETDKIESWLDRVELFLMELQATDRAQLLLDLNQQIRAQLNVAPELKVEEVLKKMGEPMQVANRVRIERGFKPRKPKTSKTRNFGTFLVLSILAGFFILTTCTLSLPFVIPWGLNRIAVQLGQQPDGVQSFRIFKGFNLFKPSHSDDSEDHDPNDLNAESPNPQASEDESLNAQENINGSFESEGISAIMIQAKSAKLNISLSNNPGITYDCKISSLGFAKAFIRKSPSGLVTLALDQVADSANCEIKIPQAISLSIQVDSGEIKLINMSQNISVEANEASVSFSPAANIAFSLEANTKKGQVKGLNEFEKLQKTIKVGKKYHAKINLQTGDIAILN